MSQNLTIEKFEYIPGRIIAAMRYIEHCKWLTDPINLCGMPPPGRSLTQGEQAAYQAALDAVRLYFAGEMDFGGAPMRVPDKRPKDKKRKRCKCEDADEAKTD
jgi:hypothetical protein